MGVVSASVTRISRRAHPRQSASSVPILCSGAAGSLLMRLDVIDEFRLNLHPYVAGEGT
jgi:hypothetical protein